MCRAAFEQEENERSSAPSIGDNESATTKVVVSDAERESWRYAVKDM